MVIKSCTVVTWDMLFRKWLLKEMTKIYMEIISLIYEEKVLVSCYLLI